MLYNLIFEKAQKWIHSDSCTVKQLFEYINKNGNLREAQIQALLVYLFLKIEGDNKSLSTLFSENFFGTNEDLSKLNINQKARDILNSNVDARALFEFSRTPLNNNGNGNKTSSTLFPDLEKSIIKNPDEINYKDVINKIFYDVEYPDYLFSLPMGAGKTFLMAAFIYLDLYFAKSEPDNKRFAHNFLILAPSGLKSSIIPSLKTIEQFDPTWILPEPAASDIRKMMKFEVLDQQKSAKKSNKARNPNAHKISGYQPFDSLMGLVMVVNAEKVILDRLELTDQLKLIEKTDDETDRLANELRNIISKIPNLQIHIDEVHHAATDEIKLRQVVNRWSKNGSINSVLGFSGTPYLSSGEPIKISDGMTLKFTQITNTVFYYPLTTAIKKFLKKPRVEQTSGLASIQIIEKGVKDFLDTFGDTVYDNGCIAKLAVYCGNIERLEEEIFPFLISTMKIKPEEILKYHKGNSKYKTTKEAETEFSSLNTPLSKKKIILLVQIGKEGWDCPSLTGVILSQKGDCPTNMVLQTSCRCLRQVNKSSIETAVIWLNEENAKSLDKQLKDEQHTSIQEISSLGKNSDPVMITRYSRMDYLKLPEIKYYQLQVKYETVVIDEDAEPDKAIAEIDSNDHLNKAEITMRGLSLNDMKTKAFIDRIDGDNADFDLWIFDIARTSMRSISIKDLRKYEDKLLSIFNAITFIKDDYRVYNNLFRHEEIKSLIRLAFHQHRELNIHSEVIPYSASLLIIDNLLPIEEHDKLYPAEREVKVIMHADETGEDITAIQEKIKETTQKVQELIDANGGIDLFSLMGVNIEMPKSISNEMAAKDRTFHYLPYNFIQSGFELKFLKEVISLSAFSNNKLEIYYNGDRNLTKFKIACYEQKNKRWNKVGDYTPDFLVIERKNDEINKVLIIETKGSGFADQPEFIARRKFMENEFLKMNNEKFGYQRFEYLYLSDNTKMNDNLCLFISKIDTFFKEN